MIYPPSSIAAISMGAIHRPISAWSGAMLLECLHARAKLRELAGQ